MTQVEWEQLNTTIQHMTPEERRQLRTLVDAATERLTQEAPASGLWGLFADEEEVLDRTLEFAYQRRQLPLRSP